jgi:flagellar motility protein MotE (MotC chaperone)
MNIGFFSPFLVLLIITLLIKGAMLLGRVQEQTDYAYDNSVHSVLVDTAYAKENDETKPQKESSSSHAEKEKSGGKKNEPATNVIEELSKPVDHPPTTPQITLSGQESIPNMSSYELQLLKELSKRRKELEKNQNDLGVKEKVLKVTEGKIDQKMAELKVLQAQLQEMLKEHDQKEKGKIMSLVKIYENMKPRDAAKIFDELEMPTLVQVVSNMKEVKVAPVIASMNPVKARDLSMELAKQKSPGQ